MKTAQVVSHLHDIVGALVSQEVMLGQDVGEDRVPVNHRRRPLDAIATTISSMSERRQGSFVTSAIDPSAIYPSALPARLSHHHCEQQSGRRPTAALGDVSADPAGRSYAQRHRKTFCVSVRGVGTSP